MAHITPATNAPSNPKAAVTSIIDEYLGSSSLSPSDAAQKLVSATEKYAAALPEDEEDSFVAGTIYDEILHRARTVPYDSPVHDQLIDLLRTLKSTPPTDQIDWRHLYPLGMSVRELWNTAPDESRESWLSLNGFVAKVTADAILDFDIYSVWSIRMACEDWTGVPGVTDELDATSLNQSIPAAAVWIFNAGEKIWALSKKAEEGDRVTAGGPRWTGTSGFSVERWNFWKERFEQF